MFILIEIENIIKKCVKKRISYGFHYRKDYIGIKFLEKYTPEEGRNEQK